MQLFYRNPQKPINDLANGIRQAYGIPKGKMPHGAAGAFCFDLPDVYITDTLASCVARSPNYSRELQEMLGRFYREDYGFVTCLEKGSNDETRWLGGSTSWMIGRYPSLYGGVVLETLHDIAILYLVEEDVSEICQSQYEAFCKKYGHNPAEENGWRINQLIFRK